MSFQAIAAVLNHSQASTGAKLVPFWPTSMAMKAHGHRKKQSHAWLM